VSGGITERQPLPKGVAVIAPIVFGAAAAGIWQWVVRAFDIKATVVPAPTDIWGQFTENFALIRDFTTHTGWNALRGLLIGAVAGVIGALVAHSVRVIREMAAPIVVALSVVPIVALGPVLYRLYGGRDDTARILVAALAVGVPVYINSLRGLQQVKPVHRELMHAYSAGAVQKSRIVTLPTATPYIFTGLRIGSSLAVISALVTEYFGGPNDGLGFGISNFAKEGKYALAWACVLGSIILGLIFYLVTFAIERWFSRHR